VLSQPVYHIPVIAC